MATTDTLYSVRYELQEQIERGRDQVLRARCYRAGELVAPASAVVSVRRPDGSLLVDEAAGTVVDDVAVYTLTGAITAGEALGDGWSVEWVLTMADGQIVEAPTDGAMVRRRLAPVVTEQDLYRRAAHLDPASTHKMSRQSDWSDKIDEAWITIQHRLIEAGNRPWLILSPSALREVHLTLALALVYEDLAGRGNPTMEARAESYRTMYEGSWKRLALRYDTDRDGVVDDVDHRRAGRSSVIWTTGRGER